MHAWLEPIHAALDARTAPLHVFFRDDDAGWEDARLLQLLDQFERHGLPLDLAVIPVAISSKLAAQLSHRARVSGLVGLHQHGFAHTNHEPVGRPCEFGPSRSEEQQYADLESGRRKLLNVFGAYLDSIFTPPWNRCTPATGRCLRQLGIGVISRDATASSLGLEGLGECPIAIDWLKKREGVRLSKDVWAAACAVAMAEATDPLGLMFHHAVMDDEDRAELEGLLALLASHASVQAMPMRQAAQLTANGIVGRAS